MSFPNLPFDGQKYTTALDTRYAYDSTRGAWLIDAQSVIGLTGIQGDTGIRGPGGGEQGVTGLQGPGGGEQGVTGVQGVTGILGINGSTGVQGVTGILGTSGGTGLQGFTGIYGQTGVQGVTGIALGQTGVQGLTGFYGQTGIQGVTGIKGSTGIGAGTHTLLSDMPDVTGVITDHDTRLVAKVQPNTPTIPPPFAGMFWWDTTGATPGNTLATTLISNTYTVLSSDELIVASGDGYNVYLPAATGSGRLLWVKYIGGSTINVDASSTQTIDGVNVQSLLTSDSLMVADYQSGKWAVL